MSITTKQLMLRAFFLVLVRENYNTECWTWFYIENKCYHSYKRIQPPTLYLSNFWRVAIILARTVDGERNRESESCR